MKRILLTLLLTATTIPLNLHAASPTNKVFTVRFYGLAEQFEWKETYQGQQLLKESGPLFGAGGDLGANMAGPFWIEGRGELFLGTVDYDGVLMSEKGELTPYKTTTEYVGLKIDGDVACKLPLSPSLHVRPFAGIGAKTWVRTLDTGLSDRYMGEYGYSESWTTVYAIVGCGGGIMIGRTSELSARLEARLPFSNSEVVDLTNQGGPSDLELKPGKQASYYAEATLTVSHLTASLFVETLNFSESPPDSREAVFFQPESKSTMVGGKLGLAF